MRVVLSVTHRKLIMSTGVLYFVQSRRERMLKERTVCYCHVYLTFVCFLLFVSFLTAA